MRLPVKKPIKKLSAQKRLNIYNDQATMIRGFKFERRNRKVTFMYIPSHFSETDLTVIEQLICENPLATIVSMRHADEKSPFNANHIPLHLVNKKGGSLDAMVGKVLRGHVARANGILNDFTSHERVLCVFSGVQAYISPSLYASKAIDGKVVPTWNYVAVHMHGTVRLIQDGPGLVELMHSLTDKQEEHRAAPWSVNDAPADYTTKLMKSIVGIEIDIHRIEAKRKLSQNQTVANKLSVVEGLSHAVRTDEIAMAEAIRAANGLAPIQKT
jgi:transcriptional regulator